MHEPVDSLFHFDKCAEVRDVPHFARNHRSGNILAFDNIPGIGLDSEALVFSDPKGKPLPPKSFSHMAGHTLKSAGLSLHGLRHMHATLLIQQVIPLRVVQERLGHGSAQTTHRYTHVMPSMQATAAEEFGRRFLTDGGKMAATSDPA